MLLKELNCENGYEIRYTIESDLLNKYNNEFVDALFEKIKAEFEAFSIFIESGELELLSVETRGYRMIRHECKVISIVDQLVEQWENEIKNKRHDECIGNWSEKNEYSKRKN